MENDSTRTERAETDVVSGWAAIFLVMTVVVVLLGIAGAAFA